MRRRVGSTRRRGNHMHDHSRFQRDINDVTGVSLSLSLYYYYSQKSLTHNIGSASALPTISSVSKQSSPTTRLATTKLDFLKSGDLEALKPLPHSTQMPRGQHRRPQQFF